MMVVLSTTLQLLLCRGVTVHHVQYNNIVEESILNESTVGADASVEVPQLHKATNY